MLCRKCKKEIPESAAFCPWCGTQQQPPSRVGRRPNGRGSIKKELNGTYTATVSRYVHGKRLRRIKRGFARKKDAEIAVDVLAKELELIVGRYTGEIEPENPMASYTVQQLHEAWMESQTYAKLSPSKQTHYRTAWNRIADTWPIVFTQMRLSHMQTVLSNSGVGYYPQRDIKALYSHLYKFAIRNELLETNRAMLLELPETPNSRRDPWTMDEVQRWWQDYRAGHRVARIILIMIYTGMRTGEVRQIDKDNVHLNERYMIGGIKTEAGKNRIIPIAENIVPLVQQSLQDGRYGLMPMRIEDFYDEYADAIQRIGVRPLDPYSCRHTTATALGEAGVAPSIIKEIMGHRSYETTLHYTHISTEAKLEAVDALANQSTGPK